MEKLKSIKIYCLVVVLFFFTTKIYTQVESNTNFRHAIFLEAGGLAGGGSVNYERIIFRKNKMKIGASIGFGTYHLKDFTNNFNPDLIFPIAAKAIFGSQHKLEVGIGQTISNTIQADPITLNPNRKSGLHFNAILGYRYQKENGRLLLRLGYTPFVEFYKNFNHWGGASIGFAF